MRQLGTRRLISASLGAGILATAMVLAIPASAAAHHTPHAAHRSGEHCDSACLDHMVDRYLAALVAHDPSQVPIAKHYEFVQNLVRMRVGEGLWKTASAVPTTFKIYVPDPVAEQVGFIGMMQENGKPIELGLRLKLHDGKIVQMEHLVASNLRAASLKNLETPRPQFSEVVPPAERTPRAKMLKIAYSYYTALVTGNGKAAPFADDCVRHENGMQTTGNVRPAQTPISQHGAANSGMSKLGALGCAAQADTHLFDYITRITPRRVWIADVKHGLVFGLSQFRQPMKKKYVTIVGIPGVTRVPMNFKPFDLPAAHIFKISGGKIHQIEAMGFTMPYDSPTGWQKGAQIH
ncbi:MAG: hypothetical protein ACREU3_02365 [Steroidobacteraceae bacterium]